MDDIYAIGSIIVEISNERIQIRSSAQCAYCGAFETANRPILPAFDEDRWNFCPYCDHAFSKESNERAYTVRPLPDGRKLYIQNTIVLGTERMVLK